MRYLFSEGLFGCISTLGGEYDTRQPVVELLMNDVSNLTPIIRMFSELNPVIFRYGPTGEQYGLKFNGNVLRQIVHALFQSNQITAHDRSNIEEHIRAFEKSIAQKTLLTNDELGLTQAEILEMIMSPYIDGIIDEVPDLSLAIKVCGIGMRDIPLSNDSRGDVKITIINNGMRSRGIKDEFEALVTDSQKRKEIYDCIWQIWRIYSQAEKLTDTFLRLGQSLPSVKLQRECIARILFKAVNNKLTPEEHGKVIETAIALLKEKYLSEGIVSEIQNPRREEVEEVRAASTNVVSYTTQNAVLRGLFLERQSRQDAEPTPSQQINRQPQNNNTAN